MKTVAYRAGTMTDSTRTPKYRLHKGTGLAVVTIDAREIYLGKHGTPESRAKYDALIARWLAGGRSLGSGGGRLASLCGEYRSHAEAYYVKRGDPTTKAGTVRLVLDLVEAWHGTEPAAEFGPRKLDAMRRHWIGKGLARSTINGYARVVVEMYEWGVSREVVPVAAWQALTTLRPLEAGRSEARESPPVRPVSMDRVRAVLAVATPKLRDQITLQLLTGMRSGEMMAMRPCDVDRSGPIWYYTAPMHKTEHKVEFRRVGIGPAAQAVLLRWLDGRADAFAFRVRSRREDRDGRVVSPRVLRPRVSNYYHAVETACLKAWPCPAMPGVACRELRRKLTPEQAEVLNAHIRTIRWTPHQLRHTAATLLRAEKDLEAARVALGHTTVAMTKRYAERGDAAWRAEVAPGVAILDRAVAEALRGNISTGG